MSKTLVLDFDGVCHQYTSPWKGYTVISDPPVPGVFEFIQEAQKHFRVAIYSTRSNIPAGREMMKRWFRSWAEKLLPEGTDLDFLEDLYYPIEKPAAFLNIDDRGYHFTGEWPDMEFLLNFRPWNRLSEEKEE